MQAIGALRAVSSAMGSRGSTRHALGLITQETSHVVAGNGIVRGLRGKGRTVALAIRRSFEVQLLGMDVSLTGSTPSVCRSFGVMTVHLRPANGIGVVRMLHSAPLVSDENKMGAGKDAVEEVEEGRQRKNIVESEVNSGILMREHEERPAGDEGEDVRVHVLFAQEVPHFMHCNYVYSDTAYLALIERSCAMCIFL